MWAQSGRAQDVEPRALTAAPVGTNIAGLSLMHSWGAVLLDKTLQVEDLDGSTFSFIASYSRYIDVFGLTGRVSAAVPFATGDWDAVVGQDSVATNVGRTGFGDAKASITVFLVGAPAMTPAEFREYRRKTTVGFNLKVSMPIGQYDQDKLINLGSNRWHVTPALGVSHQMGKWTAEGYAGAWFFTDNTSLLGDNVLSQAPLFAFQLLFAHSFRPRLWLAAGVRQTAGGRTTLNGVARDDPTQNTRAGLVLALPVAGRHTVKLIGTTGLRTTTGGDYNTVVLQWFVAW
jgi:hypothetical protein